MREDACLEDADVKSVGGLVEEVKDCSCNEGVKNAVVFRSAHKSSKDLVGEHSLLRWHELVRRRTFGDGLGEVFRQVGELGRSKGSGQRGVSQAMPLRLELTTLTAG